MPRFVHAARRPTGRSTPTSWPRAFSNKTRAIIINTPNNPTGKVFTRDELRRSRGSVSQWDVVAITDEIYEHILYDGARHVPMMTLDGMAERTVTINSLSKTFSVTGWRVGWAIAPPALTVGIRKVHDFLTVGAPAPLQEAGAFALGLPDDYYRELAAHYAGAPRPAARRPGAHRLRAASSRPGAYYVMTDIAAFGFEDDVAFARHLVEEIGVAAVPGSSFYRDPRAGPRRCCASASARATRRWTKPSGVCRGSRCRRGARARTGCDGWGGDWRG